ncbi:MAG TPA: IS200/IS605 family transposase [Polyangiaceae bacterium]|nr:IS200/IS605 family transposase [Polyangiaceae bacterium]
MSRHSRARVLVHLVWATRHRRRWLPPTFDEELVAMLGAKAHEAGCCLLAAGCASDHVHALVHVAPTIALAELVQRMKGASAFDINQHRLLEQRFAWQHGYWAESVRPSDGDRLTMYVREQRRHHDEGHTAERWLRDDQTEPASGGL